MSPDGRAAKSDSEIAKSTSVGDSLGDALGKKQKPL